MGPRRSPPYTLGALGPRLRAVADAVLEGRGVADLCCDHGYLSAALVASGRVPFAIAGDLNAGPLAAAGGLVAAAGLEDRIELRQGDGLGVLEPGGKDGVGTVALAGIGAPLAARIVTRGQEQGRLEGVERLVVQANDAFPRLGQLRAALGGLGWGLVDERLALDGGRIYVILAAERRGGVDYRARERDLGPVLSRGLDPLYPQWLARERARIEAALAGMARSSAPVEERAAFQAWLAVLAEAARG